jgi:hypothetical protein
VTVWGAESRLPATLVITSTPATPGTTVLVDGFGRVEGSDLVSISTACPKIVKLLGGEGVAADGAVVRATTHDFIL